MSLPIFSAFLNIRKRLWSWMALVRSLTKIWKTPLSGRETSPCLNLFIAWVFPELACPTPRLICQAFDQDFDAIRRADPEAFLDISGIGPVIAENMAQFFKKESNQVIVDHLLGQVRLTREDGGESSTAVDGENFCDYRKFESFC